MQDYATLKKEERERLEALVSKERADPKPAIRRKPRRLAPEDEAEIVARYERGETAVKLAPEYGIVPSTVYAMVRRAGGQVRRANSVSLLTCEQEKNVVERYALGDTSREIAKSLGVSSETIRRILRRAGVKIRKYSDTHKLHKLSKEQRTQVAERYALGETVREIAKSHSVSTMTIRRIIKRAGDKACKRSGRPKAQG